MQATEHRRILELQQVIENSLYAVAMFDRDMRYVFASARWISDYRLELTSEQLRGRCHYDVFPEIPERWKLVHQRSLAGEIVKSDAEAFPRRDGNVDWVRWEVRPYRDDTGAISGIVIFTEDVTEHRRAEQSLRASEERFRGTFDNAAVGIAHVGLDGRWLRVNDKLCQITGYARDTLVELTFQDITYVEDLETDLAYVGQVIAGTIPTYSMEKRYIRSGGSLVWVDLTVSLVRPPTGEPAFFIAIVEDISRRKEAEAALRDSESRLREAERMTERARLFELSLDLVCIATLDGRFVQLNPAFALTLGYSNAELIGRSLAELIHPDDGAPATDAIAGLAHGSASAQFTSRCRRKDGRYRWLLWRLVPSGDGAIYAVARDVTSERELMESLQSKQSSLAASLREREVLLQEVHHRVKNNLQVISSLINMQARQLGDGAALGALGECRARVEAIALIHEKLYQTNDYARVPFGDYARGLAASIFRTTGAGAGTVELVLDIEHDVSLPVGRAIPCGLILNELITNAMKHAFPAGKSGSVTVALRRRDGHLLLTVADDGIGMPANLDVHGTKSLGMHLIAMLVRQLKGQLEIDRSAGTAIRISCMVEVPPLAAGHGRATAMV